MIEYIFRCISFFCTHLKTVNYVEKVALKEVNKLVVFLLGRKHVIAVAGHKSRNSAEDCFTALFVEPYTKVPYDVAKV